MPLADDPGNTSGNPLFGTSPEALREQSLAAAGLSSYPALWGQVQDILQRPLAKGPPDLMHFPAQQAAPTHAVLAGTRNGGGNPPWSDRMTAGAIAMVVALALLLLAWRRRATRVPPRGRVGMTPALLALMFSLIAAAQATGVGESAPAVAAGPPAAHVGATSARPAGARTAAMLRSRPAVAWSTLTQIEDSINATHEQLAGAETEIAAVTAQIAAGQAQVGQPNRQDSPAPSQRRMLRPQWRQLLTAELADMVNTHTSLATDYTRALHAEYSFYVSLAQSSARAVVVQAAAADPDVQRVVTTDVETVQTQLAQEAAVAAAAQSQSAAAGAALSGLQSPVAGSSQSAAIAIAFHAPLTGVESQPFGPTQFSMEPPVVYGGAFYPHFHTGIDLAAPLDTPVGASADGVVAFAGQSRNALGDLVGYGNYVVIKHANGMLSVYGHLDRIVVSTGQTVQGGQVIGLCGSTGWSTGPHVHFEIRVNGVPVDPGPYLAAQPATG